MKNRYLIPCIAYGLMFFCAPLLVMNFTQDGFGIIIINLIILNGTTVFIVGAFSTYRYGFDYLHILLMALFYIVSCYLIFNESAIPYIIFYIIMDLIGSAVGIFLRRKHI